MATAAWGSATAKSGGGGSSDPNVLSLKEANRIRILEPGAVKWRQHFVQSATDPEQGRSVICPKGADGRDDLPCPLCMKPVGTDGKQRFPVSRRFATNVWDYESGSVKVLIAGPQVFEEFDAAAAVGLDPTQADYLIHKVGKGISTSYKVVRGDSSPLPSQITPDMMHDLAKYDTPTSVERIFEILEEMGIDYDSLEMPSFTLDEAEAFVMPYGKHKGMTVEQLVANDLDYSKYMHRVKADQGSLGDPVFIALHTVLEDRGEAAPMEAVVQTPPAPSVTTRSNGQGSMPQEAPKSTEAPSGMVTLIGPDGNAGQYPEAAAVALRAAGFKDPEPEPEPEPGQQEPEDTDLVRVDISGTVAEMPYGSAKPLIATGTATLVQDAQDTQEPKPELPADDEQVEIKLSALPTPIPMAFKDALEVVRKGQGTLDPPLMALLEERGLIEDPAEQIRQESRQGKVEQPVEQDPTNLDPSLTHETEGGWTHPALGGEVKKSKGAVTQALNRMKPKESAGNSAPANAAGAELSGKEAKLEAAKDLLSRMPEVQSDFKALLQLFQEVAGKRQITEFTESELDALIARLHEMQTA